MGLGALSTFNKLLCFAAIFTACVSFAASADARPHSKNVIIRGTVVYEHYDNRKTGKTTLFPSIRLDNGTNAFLPTSTRLTDLPPVGSYIQARGKYKDGFFRLKNPRAWRIIKQKSKAKAAGFLPAVTGTRKVLVLLINFQSDSGQPYSTAQAATEFFTGANSMRALFKDMSYDQLTLDGDVAGWYTVPFTPVAGANCAFQTWGLAAEAQAAAAGVNLTSYDHVVHMIASNACQGGGGWGMVKGRDTWIYGDSVHHGVVAHELGHNFGLNHANSMTCKNASGVKVAMSATCTTSEYGDVNDTMGGGFTSTLADHFNGWEKASLGWLANRVQTITTSGDYTVAPLELGGNSTNLLRIQKVATSPDGSGPRYFYLEYRQPTVFEPFFLNSPFANGVTVHQAPDINTLSPWTYGAQTHSQVLDATPTTSWFGDGQVAVGGVFSDPLHYICVATKSVDANGATMRVNVGSLSDTIAPSQPSNVRLVSAGPASITIAWNAASDCRGVTAYDIYRDGVKIRRIPAYTSFTDTGLGSLTSYVYTVKAVDAKLNISNISTNALQAKTTVGVPTGLKVLSKTTTDISFTWNAVSGATQYKLWRIIGATKSLITTQAGTTYAFTGLAPYTNVAVQVQSVDASGAMSALTTIISGKTNAVPPATPTGIAYTKTGTNSAKITWTPVTGASSYQIFRQNGTSWTLLGSTTTAYSARAGLVVGTPYVYAVKAVSSLGAISAMSSSVTVTL